MELYLERAMSIARLNYVQLSKVHDAEKRRGGILLASDLTEGFRLRRTFSHWSLPEGNALRDRAAREKYFERLKSELKAAGCLKTIYQTTVHDSLNEWHEFDAAVHKAIDYGQVDFLFRRPKAKSALFAEIEAEAGYGS